VGKAEGDIDIEGWPVGIVLGTADIVGLVDGEDDGQRLGSNVGELEGRIDGAIDGMTKRDGW